MKGLITKTFKMACGLGLLGMTGCFGYYDLVDPCYPARYNSMARHEVYDAFAPQVQNGHILDQTMWNYFFEDASDKLTEGGRDHLNGLVRRRPNPDARIYLATARDLAYDPAAPDKFIRDREDLNRDRIAAVQKFLNAGCLREVIFTRGCTDAINLVAQSYGRKHVQPGDDQRDGVESNGHLLIGSMELDERATAPSRPFSSAGLLPSRRCGLASSCDGGGRPTLAAPGAQRSPRRSFPRRRPHRMRHRRCGRASARSRS